jgi:hypothetical protein
MLQIQLPDNLLAEIEAAGVTGSAMDSFVQQAVREKLAVAKVAAKGQPSTQVQRALDEFDALCDEVDICAPGTHLTRDQLHERS